MGGDILPSYTEKVIKKAQKELISAVKDIRNGTKPSELKKKYSAETIKWANKIEKICNS